MLLQMAQLLEPSVAVDAPVRTVHLTPLVIAQQVETSQLWQRLY